MRALPLAIFLALPVLLSFGIGALLGGQRFLRRHGLNLALYLGGLAICSVFFSLPSFSVYATETSVSVVSSVVLAVFMFLMVSGAYFLVAFLADGLEARKAGRRTKDGHCPTCDYNLTGNVTGICPECGMSIPENVSHLSSNE